jgi:ABC-type transport system substrate-binding protein
MYSRSKWFAVAGLLLTISIILAACAPEPVVETVIVPGEEVVVKETVIVEPEVEEEVEAGGECCDVYRVGIFEDPVSLNYWNYLGPGSSVWTAYVVTGITANLYTLSDQRFDFVPSLAKDFATVEQVGDVWTLTVEMVDNAVWSDGQPITANDVVFTQNACADLQLTQNWPNQCWPTVHSMTEAVDDYTVKFTFTEEPSLGTWQAGVALAPILPQHFWADTVAASYAFIDGVTEPEADCTAEELSEADQAACDAYAEAYQNARQSLYEASAEGQPSAGGYVTEKWELGAFAQRVSNDNYYFKGARVVEYDDGTWMMTLPDGTMWQAYGEATGEETLNFVSGPYAPNIIFSIYGSQDAAFLALADGEVDYVINPLGLARGLREQAERGEGILSYTNADYGMFYLAFNLREYPQSLPGFRQAIDIVIDKEFVINNVLAGVVFPMYSTMPPGNGFWHNPDVPTPYVGMSREDRVNMAIEVLKAEGWSWSADPYWDEDLVDVVPGEGLTMPNGELMQELTILGPGPAYDPIRATFNQWISEWGRELGMPLKSELTGFNTILGPVFVDADFDLYILGWSLGNVAFPDYFEAFWHSRNDTAVSGNYNTPGLNDPAYDALVDEFMSTGDLARAQELVFEMQVLLADLRPYIPLFYKQVTDLARNNIIFPYTSVLGGLEQAAGFQTDAQPLFK